MSTMANIGAQAVTRTVFGSEGPVRSDEQLTLEEINADIVSYMARAPLARNGGRVAGFVATIFAAGKLGFLARKVVGLP